MNETDGDETQRLDRGDGVRLAWSKLEGAGPTVVFLPGFRSDMAGIKAVALHEFCRSRGQAMLRLDYSGHGVSDGLFEDGTIGIWAEDARRVIAACIEGDMILVGSSMGGWIGFLLARAFGPRIAGFIGIAAAPDFTETMIWASMMPQEKQRMLADGRITVPSEYGEPMVLTLALIEDGRRQLVLDAPITLNCPIRLLQGQQDPDVPWETALKLAAHVDSTDVQTILVKDGDHRLSRQADLALLLRTLATLLCQDGNEALAVAGIAPAIP